MTEKQSDRLQEIHDMMAELQSLRIGQPVKSVVVVQSDASPAAPSARPIARRIQPHWPGVLALLVLVAGVVWMTRSRQASISPPPSKAADSRLAQLQRAGGNISAGDADAALRQVEELCNTDCTADELMAAASAFAAAAALPTVDRDLAEHRAARAVLFLRRAATEGNADVSRWHRLPELAKLQARTDYRRLVAELLRR